MTGDNTLIKGKSLSDQQVRSQLLKTPLENINREGQSVDSHSPKTWQVLCDSDDTLIDGLYPYTVISSDGLEIELVLIRVNGALHVLHDQCPHRRVPLSSGGFIEGDVIYCGHHHWGFYLATGAHTVPTGIQITRYELSERDGKVLIFI